MPESNSDANNLREYAVLLSNAREDLEDDDMFHRVIIGAIDLKLTAGPRRFAELFGIGRPQILRWYQGKGAPLKPAKRAVYRVIGNLLDEMDIHDQRRDEKRP